MNWLRLPYAKRVVDTVEVLTFEVLNGNIPESLEPSVSVADLSAWSTKPPFCEHYDRLVVPASYKLSTLGRLGSRIFPVTGLRVDMKSYV